MGKVKAWYRSIPLRLAIFLFAVSAILSASVVSSVVSAAADRARDQITGKGNLGWYIGGDYLYR